MVAFRRLLAFSVITIACAIVIPVGQAQAAEGESITLSPAGKKYIFKPNQVLKDTITVINDGTVAYDAIVYAGPYSVENISYKPDYTSIKPRADVYKWVQFAKTKWRLEPGQKVEIPYTINVPNDVSPGGHYGVIFAETQPVDVSSVLSRKKRVGTIIYSSVEGTAKEAGRTEKLSIDLFQPSHPLTASLTVSNTGNVDYELTKRMIVTDVFGGIKHDSGDVSHIIFPTTSREVVYQWDGVAWAGIYKVSVKSTVLGNTSQKSSYVLVMPRWLLAITVLALLAIVGNVVLRKKSSQHTKK